MLPVPLRCVLGCVLLVSVACKDAPVLASDVPVDPVGLQLSTTVLAKLDPESLALEGRRLGPRTLVVQAEDTLRRISTDEGETWTDASELPQSHAMAMLGGTAHLLRLAWPQKDAPNFSLFHRTLDNPTESVAFQHPANAGGTLYNAALTALPNGLLATFTLHRSRDDSQLHALRWKPESGWTALGPIPGAALHFVTPAALVSDSKGNVYLAYLQDRGFDPAYEHNTELTDRTLIILRSQDEGASWMVVAQELAARASPSGMEPRQPRRVRLFISPEDELTLFLEQSYGRTSLLLNSEEQEQFLLARSTDGTTWAPAQRLEGADLKKSQFLFSRLRLPTGANIRQMTEESRRESLITEFSQSPNGRSMALFWRDKRQGSAQLYLRVSRDGGKSWTAVTPVDPERSVRAWPNTVLATDTGPYHLFWTGEDGTVYHSRAVLTP